MLRMKSISGPVSYAIGGFTITFGEFEKIENAIAVCDWGGVGEAANLVRDLRVSFVGNVVTIIVRQIDTTVVAPAAWAELPAGTSLSARTFTVIADGY